MTHPRKGFAFAAFALALTAAAAPPVDYEGHGSRVQRFEKTTASGCELPLEKGEAKQCLDETSARRLQRGSCGTLHARSAPPVAASACGVLGIAALSSAPGGGILPRHGDSPF